MSLIGKRHEARAQQARICEIKRNEPELTHRQIADRLGCHVLTVTKALREERRSRRADARALDGIE